MAVLRGDESDLILALHGAATAEAPWQRFLTRLRDRTRADVAALVVQAPSDDGEVLREWRSDDAKRPQVMRAMLDLFRPDGPLPLRTLRFDRVYALEEILNPRDPGHLACQRAILAPAGVGVMRLMRVALPDGVVGWLRITRNGRDFRAADSALISALAAHLSAALQAFAMMERLRSDLSTTQTVSAQMGIGWVRFATSGRVLALDPTAVQALQATPGFGGVVHGKLAVADPHIARALGAAIAETTKEGAAPLALMLSQLPPLHLLLVQDLGGALGYLRAEAQLKGPSYLQIMQIFGLSASEAKLALSLCRGVPLNGAATELSLTKETARNYSKRIYSKTGARGQADLVRMIFSSILPMV
jgi:DNA-binding CsgD family transcriptional regulator